MSESHDHSSELLLLDSSVIIGVATGQDQQRGFERRLKVAALTCDRFAILSSTQAELMTWLRAGQGREGVKAAEQVVQFLRKLHDEGSLQLIKTEIPDLLGTRRADELQQELSNLRPARRPLNALHDVILGAYAERHGVSVLTFDLAFQRVMARRAATENVNIPVDITSLDRLPVRDLFVTSNPLRAIYRETFHLLRRSREQAEELRLEISRNSDVMANLAEDAGEIRRRLHDTEALAKAWRDAARPNTSDAVVWTTIEMALSILGVAVPTTPVSYLIGLMRDRRKEQRVEGARHQTGA